VPTPGRTGAFVASFDIVRLDIESSLRRPRSGRTLTVRRWTRTTRV